MRVCVVSNCVCVTFFRKEEVERREFVTQYRGKKKRCDRRVATRRNNARETVDEKLKTMRKIL